jgi:hypothetical protein
MRMRVPSIATSPSERHFHSELSNFRHVSWFWSFSGVLGTKMWTSKNPSRMSTFTDSCSEPNFLAPSSIQSSPHAGLGQSP